jgi:chromosome segregation ATPase
MKKTIYILAVALFAGGTIITGCKSSPEKAELNVSEAKTDLAKAETDYTAAIQDLRTETDSKIAANDKRIAELREKKESANKVTRDNCKMRIAELEQKNKDMKKRMDEYKDNGKEGWESFKREFNHDMDELGKSLNDFTVDNTK